MLSSQEDQRDRRETQRQDLSVRRQQEQTGGTMHAFAVADASTPRGRYSQVTTENVVGAKADIASAYAACSPALAVQLPDEPPLGEDNPALHPLGPASPAQAPGPTSAPPLADVGPLSQSSDLPSGDAPSALPSVDVQRGGRSLPSVDPPPAEDTSSHLPGSARVGSPPLRRL